MNSLFIFLGWPGFDALCTTNRLAIASKNLRSKMIQARHPKRVRLYPEGHTESGLYERIQNTLSAKPFQAFVGVFLADLWNVRFQDLNRDFVANNLINKFPLIKG